MKQYLNSDQTAKLIELGFERPKSISSIKVTGDIITTAEDLIGEPSSVMGGKIAANYSIGELIEMLPPRHNHEDLEINRDWRFERWLVFYRGDDTTAATELIDALYAMILRLKEEGVI